MTQALYAHMNNNKKKTAIIKISITLGPHFLICAVLVIIICKENKWNECRLLKQRIFGSDVF
jgi:hypothetical protein